MKLWSETPIGEGEAWPICPADVLVDKGTSAAKRFADNSDLTNWFRAGPSSAWTGRKTSRKGATVPHPPIWPTCASAKTPMGKCAILSRHSNAAACIVPKLPIGPANPDRVCWGCDKYCPADDLACGNGTIRTPHPCELFGDDWLEWSSRRRPAGLPEQSERPNPKEG
jgi:hypothetical protein